MEKTAAFLRDLAERQRKVAQTMSDARLANTIREAAEQCDQQAERLEERARESR